MIGTTRSRVSFFMNRFRDLGFLDYNGGGGTFTARSSASCFTTRAITDGTAVHSRKYRMKQPSGRYVVSFQAQPFRKARRYYWMICRGHNPEELEAVS